MSTVGYPDVQDRPGYTLLLARAVATAQQILEASRTEDLPRVSGSFEFIRQQARALVTGYARYEPAPNDWYTEQRAYGDEAVGAVFALLETHWRDIARAQCSGEELLSDHPTLWDRFMIEWPLGSYATLVASFLRANDLLRGRILELGAGVGNTSHLVADCVQGEYVRTDLLIDLMARRALPGRVERFDFNRPGRWRDMDTIFAVNALHCARDRARTL